VVSFGVVGHAKTRIRASRRFAQQNRRVDGRTRQEELGAQRAVADVN
jgi:hypothetical protein